MITIEIDPGAGFCFGVKEVVQSAEELLKKGEQLYGLGDMVHNSQEVLRLRNLGLKTIQHSELENLGQARVLFRAHGEPPSTYKLASERKLEIMDGTCPIVLKLQERIRKAYAGMDRSREQLVIFGKRSHPETIGLLGQVNGDALVVSSVDDVRLLEKDKSVILFSQTTMDPEQFREIEVALKAGINASVRPAFRAYCTVCGQMKKRKPGLDRFVRKHDVLVFVSGKHSSNGKMLYEFCLGINPKSHWISDPGELEVQWFSGARSIGISGATSTSMEQLEAVRNQILNLTST